ncbi:MAG: hypothetical protein H6P98_2286 [Candidatus Aminicenantes bacterium]|nr:hypothetical protein [Candidatus Aminicenantes bacterium]
MKRLPVPVIVAFLVAAVPASASRELGKQFAPFYNVDTEKQVEGTIRELLFEPRYQDKAPFLILVIEEKKTGEVYRAEISPAWFFDYDLHKGESVRIVGSTYAKDDSQYLIARRLQCGGETFFLRDSRGFPSWRGGQMKRVGRHRGRGM